MARSFARVVLAILVSASVGVAAASAQTFPIASGAGVAPPDNTTVQDLYVEVSGAGGATWTQAFAAGNGFYPAPFPGSYWVVPSSNVGQGYGDPQPFLYRVHFTMPSGFSNVSLSGFFSSDDQSASVTLNGTPIAEFATYPAYPPGYVYDGSPHPFATSDASLFNVGDNVLIFGVLNLGGATGVDFQGLVTYTRLPTTKDDCKNGGWQTYGGFKNQGQCVAFVATGGRHQPR